MFRDWKKKKKDQLPVYNYTFSNNFPTSDVNQENGEGWTKAEKKELRGMEGGKAENAKETRVLICGEEI